MESSVDVCAFFAATLVVSIVVTYGDKFGTYRVISSLMIIAFFVQEASWVYSVDDESEEDEGQGVTRNSRMSKFEVERDFYDDFWPTLTIFERILLLRCLLLAALTGIRLFMDVMKKDVVNVSYDEVEEKID